MIPRDLPNINEKLGRVKKLTDLPIVMVFWRDAGSENRWSSYHYNRHKDRVIRCRSVGFLTQATKSKVTVAGSIGDEGITTDRITIPLSWTTRVVTLRPGRLR